LHQPVEASVNGNTNPVRTTDLQSTAGLVIQPPPFTVSVPRAMLRLRYGGVERTMIQEVKKEYNPSSTAECRYLIFPQLDLNPDFPLKPGAAGFIYSSREDVQDRSFSLFVGFTRSKKAVWRYFGEYRTEKCEPMSKEHFRSLSNKVSMF